MRRLAASAALLAAALITLPLTACDDGAVADRRDAASVVITMDDFSFRPQRVRVRAGEVRITIRNEGVAGHNLQLRPPGAEKAPPPLRFDTIRHGERLTRTVRVRRGTYRMICTIPRHEELGHFGFLVVTRR